jgi:hypothetical protein
MRAVGGNSHARTPVASSMVRGGYALTKNIVARATMHHSQITFGDDAISELFA